MLKNNYHTHCRYCHHAQGEVKDYVKKAVELGFEELGMTDHGPVIENLCELYGEKYSYFGGNMSNSDIPLYLKDIQDCKNEFKSRIKIYTGFETEYLPKGLNYYKKLRKMTDYLILGMHYFEHNDGIISTYDSNQMNYTSINSYAEACIKGMETGLFNVLAHPDLFMISYKNINGERKFDDAARQASRRIIKAAIKNNVYLEINANGLRNEGADHPYTEWNYPYYEFWEIVKEYPEAKLIIGADAHNPEVLNNRNIIATEKFIKMMGLKVDEKMTFYH